VVGGGCELVAWIRLFFFFLLYQWGTVESSLNTRLMISATYNRIKISLDGPKMLIIYGKIERRREGQGWELDTCILVLGYKFMFRRSIYSTGLISTSNWLQNLIIYIELTYINQTLFFWFNNFLHESKHKVVD
jgi:hypothetical protein